MSTKFFDPLEVDQTFKYLEEEAQKINAGLLVIEEITKTIVRASKIEEYLGYTDKEIIGKNLSILFDPVFAPKHEKLMDVFKTYALERQKLNGEAARSMRPMARGRVVDALAANDKKVKIKINIDYYQFGDIGFFLALIDAEDDAIAEIGDNLKAAMDKALEEVKAAAKKAKAELAKKIAAGGGIVAIAMTWYVANSETVNKFVQNLGGLTPNASQSQKAENAENSEHVLKIEPISVRDRDLRLRELRDKIGAISVGLFRLEEGEFKFVIDQDDRMDVYIKEFSVFVHPDPANALDALDCYGGEGHPQLADIAPIIDPKDFPEKKGELLYPIACPTYYIDKDFRQINDGALIAVFRKPIKDRRKLERITKQMWIAAPTIKPIRADGFNFKN